MPAPPTSESGEQRALEFLGQPERGDAHLSGSGSASFDFGQPQQQQPPQQAPAADTTPETAVAPAAPAPTVAERVSPEHMEATRQHLAVTFPGAKLSPLPAHPSHQGGYRVEFANGKHVDTIFVPEISGDANAVRSSLAGKLGREPSPEEVRAATVAGAFFTRTKDGRQLSGLGAIALVAGQADDATIKHEALHLAREAGLFTPTEWQALRRKYAADVRDSDVEERIASSREAWADATVGEKVVAFLRKLLESLGLVNARTVEVLMQTPDFWARQGKAPAQRETEAALQVRTGRPDLANPGLSAGARQLVDDVDTQRNASGEPQRRADSEALQEATTRLTADYAGEKAKVLTAASEGHLRDVDVIIAKEIINREAEAGMRRGDVTEAVKLIDAYRRQGTEQGRAFRQRRDPVETPDQRNRRLLTEAVLTPPKKRQKQIDEALERGDTKTADKRRKEWSDEFEKLKAKLKLLGVDLDNLNNYGYDPIKAAQAIGTVQAAKADYWDKQFEYWRNSILSGWKTQSANILGTVGNAGWKFVIERPIEATLNLAAQRPEGAQFGEFAHLAGGILPGLARGARNAIIAFKTEMPELERQIGRPGEFKIEEPNVAIGGRTGKVVRLPQRVMLMADEFLKTTVAQMDVGAQAYRIAKGEGLTGPAMTSRINLLMADTESAAWAAAHDTALDASFQQPGSELMKKVKRRVLDTRRDLPGLRYLLPFITTPVNILEQSVRKSPLGSIGVARTIIGNVREGRHALTGVTPRLAEQVVAWGVTLAIMSLMGDEDDPFLTGAEQSFNKGARDLSRRTHPPQSIRIGGRWYSYSRIEPLATVLATTVDWVNALRSGNEERMVATPFKSIIGQLKEKTFLDGLGDLLRVTEAQDPVDALNRWGSSFLVSWVPNAIRSTASATGDTFPERGVWGKGGERAVRFGRRIVQRTEVGIIPDEPAVDLWGRAAKRGTSPVTGTDVLWRIVSPIDTRVPDIFIGDKVLLNWNNQHQGEEKYPDMPQRKIGERYLSDKEYTQFVELSGATAKLLVERLTFNVDKPTEDDIEALEKAISEGRRRTREAITAGGPLPIATQLAGAAFDHEISQRSAVLASKKPIKVREIGKWQTERAEAIEWLRTNQVDRGAVLDAYSDELRKIKTDSIRKGKREQLTRSLQGL